MERPAKVKPDIPGDAFGGTANYYAWYRVPYPEQLLKDLVQRAGINGKGRRLE